MAQLEKRVAHMRDMSEAMGPDMAGHGAREYADRWLLTSEDRGALVALRDRAGDLQRSGNSALREILEGATRLLGRQIFRFEVLTRYWSLQEALKIHHALLQPLLEKSSQSDRSQTTAHLQIALDGIPDLYFSAMTIADVESMKREGPRINAIAAYPIGVYNDERQRLAALFAPADLVSDSTTLSWENHAPCNRRSTQTSGQRVPRLEKLGPDASFYPAASRLARVEGVVIVNLTVAANGCLLRVEIRRSSGAPELDAAALRRMSQATFLSAEKDQQPIEASVPLIVRFRLTDG